MPNHWRATRGRPTARAEDDQYPGEIELSRRPLQKTQHVDATANTTVAQQDAEKLRSKRSFSRTRTDIDRPRTAGAGTQPTSNSVERPPRGSSRAYTAEAQRPVVQRLDFKTASYMDEDMIGMALGSPSHPPYVQHGAPDNLYAPMAYRGVQAAPGGTVESKPNGAKAGKWKKFGGLFKSKHNPSIPAATTVPQPSQPQHMGQSVDGTDVKPPPLPKDIPKIGQTLARPEPAPPHDTSIEEVHISTITINPTQLPKLDVDIPDVQMDRYSVMFGNLLRSQQSSNLLARRSRALEKLKTTSDENERSQDPRPLQEQPGNAGLAPRRGSSEENEQLKPPSSSRRATSPTPTKSPIFSLFPQPPSTPRRSAATTSQAKPSPLQRSFTAPSRLSPMEETLPTKRPQAVKPNVVKRRKSSISLVETSASTTQGPGWSTDGSYLSPNSSVSSVSDEILFDIKKLSMVTENQEPQYEVTNPDGEAVELYRARSQKLRAVKPSALKLTSKLAATEGTKHSAPTVSEIALSGANVLPPPTGEAPNNVEATVTSLNPEYLLPSMYFIPPAKVQPAKETSAPAPKYPMKETVSPLADFKELSAPEPSWPAAPGAESSMESPVQMDESADASQDILAAAVMGTLDHMGEQSSLRAASPMPDSPGLRVPTPEKPVKLLVIPKNIPISKYSLRPAVDSHSKTNPISRSASPQPWRAVTEPLLHEQAFAARAAGPQAAPAIPNNHVTKTTAKSNSGSTIVSPQAKDTSKVRGPQPGLSIVSPMPAAATDTPNGPSSPIEVTVARQVSLSRKQSKRLLIPPAGKRLEGLGERNGEKVVNTQALMPVIVDANKAHRPGKSLAVSIVNI